MIVRALACDYDGTLAVADRIVPAALEALRRARAAGLRLILVTGRTFFELVRVCEPLDLFDVVVAENGAVLYHPGDARIHDLGPAPSPALLRELDRRGIGFQAGRVIVGVGRADQAAAREALAATGVRMVEVLNRAALMLLPAGLDKGAGTAQAIRALGLSRHDVLGIGDAENDVDLFAACGWRACPGNAVPELAARADWMFAGVAGEAVARGIADVLAGRLDYAAAPAHQLLLGWSRATAEPVLLPERGVNVLVHGDSLAGKSWLAGALVEMLHERQYAVCVLDPEGDYGVLDQLGGVRRHEIAHAAGVDAMLDTLDGDPSALVIGDLSGTAHPDRVRLLRIALWRAALARHRLGRPHWMIVDEAHLALPPRSPVLAALDSPGGGIVAITYRASWLAPAAFERIGVYLLARTTDPAELACLRGALGPADPETDRILAAVPSLPRGEFLAVRRGDEGRLVARTFVAAARRTVHVRHLTKYVDAEVQDPARHFVFRSGGVEVARAGSLGHFLRALAETPDEGVLGHARRGDFSRWVRDVFSDAALARQIAKAETRHVRGESPDLRAALVGAITARYGSPPD